MKSQNVWFVTGASKGLGLALVQKLLQHGYRVAATSRRVNELIQTLGNASEQFLPLSVNLTDAKDVKKAVDACVAHFGRLDVVVNNAGYGIGGTVEELSQAEIQQNFNVNVFAGIHVIQATMPYLRKQRSGHIINVASIAGFAPGGGWPIYAAAKYAMVGLSESLAQDVRSLGIHVTAVAPGAFRTEFLSADSLTMTQHPIADYADVRAIHARFAQMEGKQAGDPEKAAEAFIQLTKLENPPTLLFLGSDAYRRASEKIHRLKEELEHEKELTVSTDFPS